VSGNGNQPNRELLLQGRRRRKVSDLLCLAYNARQSSLLYRLDGRHGSDGRFLGEPSGLPRDRRAHYCDHGLSCCDGQSASELDRTPVPIASDATDRRHGLRRGLTSDCYCRRRAGRSAARLCTGGRRSRIASPLERAFTTWTNRRPDEVRPGSSAAAVDPLPF